MSAAGGFTGPRLDIALVNNMPDGALIQTDRQFAGLLRAGTSVGLSLRHYTLPDIRRGPAAAEYIERNYLPISALFDSRPAAVVITGCEPHASDLTREPYWDCLARVLEWARENTSSTVASCLAAHAALLRFDRVHRRQLSRKCSGLYRQVVQADDSLTSGIPTDVAIPHSRQNEVPLSVLVANGYRAQIASAEVGWTVASKEFGSHLLVLMQGHPEYDPDSLLLEYRRDVRRYASGERPSYPDAPVGYFDPAAGGILDDLRVRATAARPRGLEHFPTDALAAHVRGSWRRPALRLYENWLSEVARRMRENVQCVTTQ